MPVNTLHPQYKQVLPRWQMMRDVCDGEKAIKAGRERYLPKPNKEDNSIANHERYNEYLDRAVFLEVTKDTLDKYTGQAFGTDPALTVDSAFDYLKTNADGSDISIYQIAQKCFIDQMKYGRCGLLVEYGKASDGLSIKDQEMLDISPKIKFYDAFSIINWQMTDKKLSLLVLAEQAERISPTDRFETEYVEQWRCFYLDEGYCFYEVWQNHGSWQIVDDGYLTGASGKLDYIPFVVIGSDTNDWSEQSIPLESLARLNIAHYRNSADYEDSVFRCGQVQPVIKGITTARLQKLEQQGVSLGSATALLLEVGSDFSYVQAGANTLASDAMDKKYINMQHMGAKLIEPTGVNKTATQTTHESNTQNSVASMCVANLNEGVQKAIGFMHHMANRPYDGVTFKVKQEFVSLTADPQTMTTLSTLVQAGLAPRTVMFDYLRSHNLLNSELTDDDIIGMIDSEFDTSGYSRAVQEAPSE